MGAETPVYPEDGDRAVPVEENSEAELLPEFETHKLPRPSKPMELGLESPAPEKGEPAALVPVAVSSVRVLVPALAIQALPVVSIATAAGELSEPPT